MCVRKLVVVLSTPKETRDSTRADVIYVAEALSPPAGDLAGLNFGVAGWVSEPDVIQEMEKVLVLLRQFRVCGADLSDNVYIPAQ
jgi:hypothetical protein